MKSLSPRVFFQAPDLSALRRDGWAVADLHVHTSRSDGLYRPERVAEHAMHLGIGCAVTDHNEAGGVRAAAEHRSGLLVIPGIEVSAADGPHLLFYFPSVRGLEDFFREEIRDRRGMSPYMAISRSTTDLLAAAEGYDCLRVAAHPFGYAVLDRGVLKCVENGRLDRDVLKAIDGVEAICGGMNRSLNRRAAEYAAENGCGITGGTDAHILSQIGGTLTCCRAETAEEFIEEVRARRSRVYGQETNRFVKVIAGCAISWRFLPYTIPSIAVHAAQTAERIRAGRKK
ncbi:PHP domain-containing protein [Methanofollis fontis]|nr:PHP-associated domain-containing protein [Methanofollis fontis]